MNKYCEEQMPQFLTDGPPYSIPYRMKMLTESFDDAVRIAKMNGKHCYSGEQDFYKLL